MNSKIEALQLLLDDTESFEQAVELILAMDDPHVWETVLTLEEPVKAPQLRLLSHLPAAHPVVKKKRLGVRSVYLTRGANLDAATTPNLESITAVMGRRRPTWLPELKKLSRLVQLRLQNVLIEHIDELNLPSLESLALIRCQQLPGVPVLPELHELELTMLAEHESIVLPAQPSLRSLTLHRAADPTSYRDWDHPLLLSPLTTLTINEWGGFTLSLLEACLARLERLHVGSYKLVELGLEEANSLRQLTVQAPSLATLDSLRSVRTLEELTLVNCHTLESLEPLGELPALRKVSLLGTTPGQVPDVLRKRITHIKH